MGSGCEDVGGSSGVPGTFRVSWTSFNKFRLSRLSARAERGIASKDRALGVLVPEGPATVASELAPDNTVPRSDGTGEDRKPGARCT